MSSPAAAELVVPGRFNGPPDSANGGYVAGLLAEHLLGHGAEDPAPVRVVLRQPPPLETTMRLEAEPDGGLVLSFGGTRIAEAHRVEVPGTEVDMGAGAVLDPVPEVSPEEARAATTRYAGLRSHPFPTCFACGTDRDDGLAIHPGPVGPGPDGLRRVAATWTPSGSVDLPTTWSALDCSGGWAADLEGRRMVLGTMTAQVDALPVVGEEHVVVGEQRRTEGRRTWTASTLYDPDGRIVGRAVHVWVALLPA